MIKTIIILLSLLFATYSEAPAATYLYASTAGSGSACTEAAPCSLSTAKTTARTYTAAGDVTVYLRGGTYALSSPLTFAAADSGVAGKVYWRNYPGETPVLSGGVQITGWSQVGSTGIWQATVPGGANSRQLYVNGSRATRARRTVNMGSFSTSTGSQYTSTDGTFPSTINRPGDLEFVFNEPETFHWTQHRLGVASYSRGGSTSTFTMDSGGVNAWVSNGHTWPGNPSWVENAYEFLSASTPGQWYLNSATSTVYYVPTSADITAGGMASADVRLPVAEQIITSTQSDPPSNIDFSGITFAHAGWLRPSEQKSFIQIQTGQYLDAANGYTWGSTGGIAPKAAVTLEGAYNVNFIGCTFQHLGGQGVVIHKGSKTCSIMSSTLSDISSNAIELGDVTDISPALADQTSAITIQNNTISSAGVEYWGGASVKAGYVDNIKVLHNEISNSPYSGITFGWGWAATGYCNGNEIGWNKIHDVLTNLHDGGGIYSLGAQGSSNHARVHDNYLYNIGNGTNVPSDSGLYADEGTNYVDYTNNVVVRGGANPNAWWFSNGSTSGNNTATGNYASSSLGIVTGNGPPSTSGISAATVITGTDPTGWPVGAQNIAAASGPVAATTTAKFTATMRASFR